DLVGAVDPEVLVPDATNLGLQPLVPHLPRRGRPGRRRVIGGRGELQHAADRLDPPALAVHVDEAHHLGGRGSSSRAKKAEAAFNISLARRSSRFSRSSSRIRSRSALLTPGRRPPSTSARRTHLRSVSGVIPNLPASDEIAAHSDGYSFRCSTTIRTARSRSSCGYRVVVAFAVVKAPSSQ